MTVWGVFSGDTRNAATRLVDRYGHPKEMPEAPPIPRLDAAPRVILMYAWAERLSLSDLVAKVALHCKKLKVDRLLVEAKASGISVAQEIAPPLWPRAVGGSFDQSRQSGQARSALQRSAPVRGGHDLRARQGMGGNGDQASGFLPKSPS